MIFCEEKTLALPYALITYTTVKTYNPNYAEEFVTPVICTGSQKADSGQQARSVHSKETPCRFISILQSIQFNYKLTITSPEPGAHRLELF